MYINTEILLANGTYKTAGELRKGDLLIGGNGKPVRIKRVVPSRKDVTLFAVSFANEDTIRVPGDHKWLTTRKKDRHNPIRTDKGRINIPREAQARKTEEIYATLKSRGEYNHRVPLSQGAHFINKMKLPVAPYLFGLWLGDGTKRSSSITTMDLEIVNYLEKVSAANEWTMKLTKHQNGGKAKTYRINGGLQTALRSIGVIGNKMIPDIYMYSKFSDRLELLRGLMDSDGSINKEGNFCEITQKNRSLACDILFLIVSLGMNPKMHEKLVRGKYYNRITFRPSLQVFNLSRKKIKFIPQPLNKKFQSIIDVRETFKGQSISIEVENEKTYCIGPFLTVSS